MELYYFSILTRVSGNNAPQGEKTMANQNIDTIIKPWFENLNIFTNFFPKLSAYQTYQLSLVSQKHIQHTSVMMALWNNLKFLI